MSATLADFWPTLCPALPPLWDTPANRASLQEMAQQMAPIPRIGLECRLDTSVPRLDVQQCIVRDEGEPALLRDFICATQPLAGDGAAAWARLQRFCTAWADPMTLLHQGIVEVFLEYDLARHPPGPQPHLTPSLFFAVAEAGTTPAAGEAVAQAALALLLPTPWPPGLADNLARCFAHCPAGAYIGYIGAMLGRSTQALRVNIKGLRLDDLSPFLRIIGWPGSLTGVEPWAAWCYDRVDRVTLCLDVGAVISPRLALECILTLPPPAEPRWQELLAALSTAGLCTPDNAAAFLSLPGVLCPPQAQADWPAWWIAATLRVPADLFSTVECWLSHLKLTVLEQNAALTGYAGAGHVWRRAGPQGEGVVVEALRQLPRCMQERPPAPIVTPDARQALGQVLARAVAFLLSQQAHTGRWRDFLLPPGPSDEWVTAFVASCMLETPEQTAHTAAWRAWQALLCRRRGTPGWGYNRLTPADADSTAWALRLAAGLGILQDERVAAARHFLAGHMLADGSLTTYAAHDPMQPHTRLSEEGSLTGWHAAHACVTAAAAPFAGAPAWRVLAGQQAAAGHWQGYWWWDDEYTTALAAEALAASGDEALSPAVAQAVTWAHTRVSTAGAVHAGGWEASPWATAWCVRLLRLGTTPDDQAVCARAVQWLVQAQHNDGSWRASARLRMPMPGQIDAAGQEQCINGLDQHRVFTTAAVTAALSMSAKLCP
jgi:hypothetical protein